jgi:hypothetical protein
MPILAMILALQTGQVEERPTYAREGDRIEQEFLAHRDRLISFFDTLRGVLDGQSSTPGITLPRLQAQDAPPPSVGVRYGYGVLPRIVDNTNAGSGPPVSVFSYSWPITDGYIAGERTKLDMAEARLHSVMDAPPGEKAKIISDLVAEYRRLLNNQRTIDQYIQYNQFWQRSIAQDRVRFDQLTKVYDLMKSDDPDIAQAIREVLGKPLVPSFITIDRRTPGRIVMRVPVYADIEDQEFLAKAKRSIEDLWQARDGETTYCVEIDFRLVPPSAQPGDHIDVRAHAEHFPEDGAVLTTGAQTTYSFVGRYVALAPGDLPARTLAHEFGHVLGFRDGYIRGYRDLGEHGFEILELTSVFDDIMSAPREGHVQVAHFKLMMDALGGR